MVITMHKRISQAAAVISITAMLITGCTTEGSNIGLAKDKEQDVVDTGFTVTSVGSYDSADTAVILSIDLENKSIGFLNMDTGKQYTLYYDGTTYIKDKYEGAMTASQLKVGDVVDVNFLKGKRQIASVQLSPNAWVYSDIENYNLGGVNKTASIGASTYSLPDNAVILSDGKRTEVMDVVAQDTVTISGIGHTIYSVNVEKGHGYLRLKNEQALIGGWIEVGNSVIKEITEDMLLVVPEGSYQVMLSNDGVSCEKDVVIERNKEVVLDVGDLEIASDKTGRILFSVTPETATVSVDGTSVDISKAVELTYGIHQVHLEASGYESLTKYIQVGSENASISFTLEESAEEDSISGNSLPTELTAADSEEEQDTISGNSISENTVTASSTNKVYIDAPKDVEVYLDSNYIGITPVSFKKTVGSHTISLRKSGYTTKSYTIYLYNDGEDITYSFTDLEKETATASTSTTSSEDSTTTTSETSTSSSSSGTTTTSDTSTVTSDTSTTTSDTSTTTSDTSTTTSDTSTTTSDTSTTTSDMSTTTSDTSTTTSDKSTTTSDKSTATSDTSESNDGDNDGSSESNGSEIGTSILSFLRSIF
jgi:hypothetical protein